MGFRTTRTICDRCLKNGILIVKKGGYRLTAYVCVLANLMQI